MSRWQFSIYIYQQQNSWLNGLILWHIKHCRLFNTESSLCIYIKYMIWKHILFITFLHEPELFFHKVKWFQEFLSNTNNSIQYWFFVCTQGRGYTYWRGDSYKGSLSRVLKVCWESTTLFRLWGYQKNGEIKFPFSSDSFNNILFIFHSFHVFHSSSNQCAFTEVRVTVSLFRPEGLF